MSPNKILLFLPTYNEAENVLRIFSELSSLPLQADILFLDDNSPDGTGKIIDGLVEKHSHVKVIHRKQKLGIGSAHKEGIRYAYANQYETLITMDSDFTHSPSYILDFINNSGNTAVVVGSRFLQKNSLSEWNLFRKTLTHVGHFLTVYLLSMPYDASGAFRLYTLSKTNQQAFELVQSNGYSFFFESLFILHYNKTKILEIPIELPSRTYGTSKMTWHDAWSSLSFLMKLFKRKVMHPGTLMVKKQA